MFKHLQEIDYKLYERYLTLEKTLKREAIRFTMLTLICKSSL